MINEPSYTPDERAARLEEILLESRREAKKTGDQITLRLTVIVFLLTVLLYYVVR